MELVFKTQIKLWKTKAKGRTYRRYVIVVPKEIAELLDVNRKYVITISDTG